eukprot:CAMPEP_0170516238 /NCGR_PEP_ID=MMETSP0209-20121228/2515_1 /TAXON_ID=665100 ORGANISM="Litonotus pictus, Strain P1" /NCGR_SAMPLE_ID=MMETSP0209 /ASSEMBLY_ACC=CAM_ASM_000301 /LENGTH=379 /DNA_ID=CAMNT_0010801055 /DNA_START=57 /DNA_END=1196 /DNA_ORIENTATION=+
MNIDSPGKITPHYSSDPNRQFSLFDFVLNLSSDEFKQKAQLEKLAKSIKSSTDSCNFTFSFEVLLDDDRVNKEKLLQIANYLIAEPASFPLMMVNRKLFIKVILEFNKEKNFKKEFDRFLQLIEEKELVSEEDLNFNLLELDLDSTINWPLKENKDNKSFSQKIFEDFFSRNELSLESVKEKEYLGKLIERVNTSTTVLSDVDRLIETLSDDGKKEEKKIEECCEVVFDKGKKEKSEEEEADKSAFIGGVDSVETEEKGEDREDEKVTDIEIEQGRDMLAHGNTIIEESICHDTKSRGNIEEGMEIGKKEELVLGENEVLTEEPFLELVEDKEENIEIDTNTNKNNCIEELRCNYQDSSDEDKEQIYTKTSFDEEAKIE